MRTKARKWLFSDSPDEQNVTVISEKRETNEGSPMISPDFCLKALSRLWYRDVGIKESSVVLLSFKETETRGYWEAEAAGIQKQKSFWVFSWDSKLWANYKFWGKKDYRSWTHSNSDHQEWRKFTEHLRHSTVQTLEGLSRRATLTLREELLWTLSKQTYKQALEGPCKQPLLARTKLYSIMEKNKIQTVHQVTSQWSIVNEKLLGKRKSRQL